MAQTSFKLTGDVNVEVTVSEQADGTLKFDVVVLDETGSIGDLNGLFFDIADDGLASGLIATGDDMTGTAFNANKITKVDGYNNVNGEVAGEYGKFDGGVQFGTSGIGADDIRETSFILSHVDADLTLEDILSQDFAVRLTSVGEEDGARGDSLKIGGEAPDEPDPEEPPVDDPPVDDPDPEEPPVDDPPVNDPDPEEPPADDPPLDDPDPEEPPADDPPLDDPDPEEPPVDDPPVNDPDPDGPPPDGPSLDDPDPEGPPPGGPSLDDPDIDAPPSDDMPDDEFILSPEDLDAMDPFLEDQPPELGPDPVAEDALLDAPIDVDDGLIPPDDGFLG